MISVVIPIYKSSAILSQLYARLNIALLQLGRSYEIIFVEDCGGDDAWDILQNLAASHQDTVRAVKLAHNAGQHAALLCGIRIASGDIIVTMDDDLQHPPETICQLLRKLEDVEQPCDVVYGTPVIERQSLWRNVASRLTKGTMRVCMGIHIAEQVSSYRIFRSYVRNAFADYKSPVVNIDVLLTWGASTFASVPIHFDSRLYGTSGYTLSKLLLHAFNMITGFSTLPLRIASILGIMFAFFGLAILCYTFAIWIIYGSLVQGFYFIASIISIFSGVQLLAIGILGEYVSRIFMRSTDKPSYIIQHRIPQ